MNKEECIILFERYILNTATAEEVKQLSHWIKHNTDVSGWLESQILNSSNEMDKDIQLQMLFNIKSEISKSTHSPVLNNSKKSGRNQFRLWLRIAAMLILPLLTAAGVYLYMSANKVTESLIVSVDRGQKASIILPDGSKAWLNSLSKLTYKSDYNTEKRILELDGEAYFEVAHNPDKPFIVQSKDFSVEALGTAFGVKAYNEDIVISGILMKGRVKVTTPGGTNILKPNERIVYDRSSLQVNKSKVTNAVDFTGWIHNELRFENESLVEIAKSIQRIYNVEIIFSTERLKNLRYTGTVDNNSLESLLNIITLTSPISFKVDRQTVLLFENQNLMKHFNQ